MLKIKTGLLLLLLVTVSRIKAQTTLQLIIQGEVTGGTVKKGQKIFFTGSNLPFSAGGSIVLNDKNQFSLDLSTTPFAELKVQDLYFAADTTKGKTNEYTDNCYHRIRLSNIKNFMYNQRLNSLQLKTLLYPFCTEYGAAPPEIGYGTRPDASLEDSLTGSFAISYNNSVGYLHLKNHSLYEINSGGLNENNMNYESGFWSLNKGKLLLTCSRQRNDNFGILLNCKSSRAFTILRTGKYKVLQLSNETGERYDRSFSYLGMRNDSAGISTRLVETNTFRNTAVLSIHNRNFYPVGELVYQVEWIAKASGTAVFKKEIRAPLGTDNQDLFHPLIYGNTEVTVTMDTRPGDEFYAVTDDEEPDMTKYELRFSLIRHVLYKK
jgi:hypothetical protein